MNRKQSILWLFVYGKKKGVRSKIWEKKEKGSKNEGKEAKE